MKTPEEIKEDAEICLNHPLHETCNHCRLYNECDGMAEHIIKELYDLVLHVEREKSELMKDFKMCVNKPQKACRICKNRGKPVCGDCVRWDLFEWRGVCPENTKEE